MFGIQTEQCSATNLELVFVADNTAKSSGSAAWSYIQQFIWAVVEQFNIGSNAVRVAFVTYTDSATINFNLYSLGSKAQVDSSVAGVSYVGQGSPNLAAALNVVQNQVAHL